MSKTAILVVGQGKTDGLSTQPEWEIVYTSTVEETIEKMLRQPFDAMVIGNDREPVEKKKLKTFAGYRQEKIIVLSTTGDHSDRLAGRLKKVLQKRTAARMSHFKIKDDAFAHAKLNIQIQ